jgi:hypothetical protein
MISQINQAIFDFSGLQVEKQAVHQFVLEIRPFKRTPNRLSTHMD